MCDKSRGCLFMTIIFAIIMFYFIDWIDHLNNNNKYKVNQMTYSRQNRKYRLR